VKIAVVGSGNMGGALGRLFAGAGHAVAFSYSRDAAKLRRLARASGSGARAASSPADAVSDADVVLLAVHWNRVASVLRAAGNLRGKIVIDCTNPMNASDSALTIGLRTSGGETIARRLRGARVVKAFNTVPSELYRAGADVFAEQPGVCYCGDDNGAKRVVARLIRDIGFEPVDCGKLATARYLEPFALLVGELAYNHGRSPKLGVRFLRPI
jgi:predicted dinucleotide-binding enzyme